MSSSKPRGLNIRLANAINGIEKSISPSSPRKMNRGLRAEGRWNNNNVGRPYTPDEEIREAPAIDMVEFAGEEFRPDAYIQKALSNATEEGVRAFLETLRESKDLAASDLQRNVYKNYNEFVVISQEISKLESDMLVLRGLLNELRNASDNLRDDSTESINIGPVTSVTSEPIVPRGRNPTLNNATDMQSIWKAQIQELWAGVEGAQNFVSLEPGRHILRECSNFVEISFSTNKPKQSVHIFLLTDCLLVASKKKRQASKDTSKAKLVADRCFSLEDITLIDMKDTEEQINFIKILKHPTDQFIFQAGNADEKKNLLNMTKRATDEMMSAKAVKHADSVIAAQSQQQQHTPLIRTLSRKTKGPMPSLRASRKSVPRLPTKTLRELTMNDIREIEDLADELDVHIATREFEEAVENIEKAKNVLTNVLSSNPTKLDAIRTKMEDRVVRLSLAISRDLANPDVKKSHVQKCARWLLRLGYGEQARELFLVARTENIRIRTKQLKFEGDIPQYINELSLVYFTLIKNTCDWYNSAFRDTRMASGLVKWVQEEMGHYASMFKRQVYSLHNRDDSTVQECLRYAREHCLMLREVGLDLKFSLDNLLRPNKNKNNFSRGSSDSQLENNEMDTVAEGAEDD
ncbi:Cullin repeat-like-containing domain protein [Glomus cerebriforme]|uniref:Exocyst complex component EXO84 n=1 Tax=Glomus cerebriforme TaxID=658196 RepID=A0A397T927_9GLOM|nr:Cullin repeat-like-containing domain protein [Glomus cerebriforme]